MSDATADHQKFPSTAHVDSKGNYVADERNQTLAFANTSAHSLGQLRHPGGKPGYCAQHSRLGCTSEDCT